MYNKIIKIIWVWIILWWCFWLYALWVWYPNTMPEGELWDGKIWMYMENIMKNCAVNEYVQWFDEEGKIICKRTNIFKIATIGASTSHMTWGSGVYVKYLAKILNDCWNGNIVVWFDAGKNMVCKSNANMTKLLWMGISTVENYWGIIFPWSLPWWELPDGIYGEKFSKIFQTCWENKYMRWYDSEWNILCGDLIQGKCGSANGGISYSQPVTNLCSSWVAGGMTSNIWSYTWTCEWNEMWWSESCSTLKKVDGWWGNWSDWSACSVSCGWWSQNRTRTCNNPTPQNGGNTCSWVPIETKSCNTHACCDANVWQSCTIWSTSSSSWWGGSCPPGMTYENNNCRSDVRWPDTFSVAYNYCKNNFWTTRLVGKITNTYYPLWRVFSWVNHVNYQCPTWSFSCYTDIYPPTNMNVLCWDLPSKKTLNQIFSSHHIFAECPGVYNEKAYYYCSIEKTMWTIQCDGTCK